MPLGTAFGVGFVFARHPLLTGVFTSWPMSPERFSRCGRYRDQSDTDHAVILMLFSAPASTVFLG
jgi:hypothetical protein